VNRLVGILKIIAIAMVALAAAVILRI